MYFAAMLLAICLESEQIPFVLVFIVRTELINTIVASQKPENLVPSQYALSHALSLSTS